MSSTPVPEIPGPYGTEERPVLLLGGMLACRIEAVLPADLDEDESNEHDAWGRA